MHQVHPYDSLKIPSSAQLTGNLPSDLDNQTKIEKSNNEISDTPSQRPHNENETVKTLELTSTAGRAAVVAAPEEQIVRKKGFSKSILKLLKHQYMGYFLNLLTLAYLVLFAYNFYLTENILKNSRGTALGITIAELIIILAFFFVCFLRLAAAGYRDFLKDNWNVFDTIVILGSLGITMADLIMIVTYADDKLNGRAQALLRVLRFMIVFRRMWELTHNPGNSFGSIFERQSPIEKILITLKELSVEVSAEPFIQKDIDWCINVITNNKLYQAMIDEDDLQFLNDVPHDHIEESEEDEGDWEVQDHMEDKQQVRHAKTTMSPKKRGQAKATDEQEQKNAKFNDMTNWFDLISPEKKEERLLRNQPNIGGSPVAKNRGTGGIRGLHRVSTLVLPDRIEIPATITDFLTKHVEELNFDPFQFKSICGGFDLPYLLYNLFDNHAIFPRTGLNPTKFYGFALKMQAGYHEGNPYHNATHATDVVQTVNYFLTTGQFSQKASLTPLELAAMFSAAACHDYDHPGRNNLFHINTRDELAIRYNDKSVLEMHHIASTSAIITQPKYCFVETLSKEHAKHFRERMIAMVLATDMTFHFSELNKLKARLSAPNFDLKTTDKNLCMESLVHAADISNPAKSYNICEAWAFRVLEEFFAQGDEEKVRGIPISFMMDKITTNKAKSQIGFIQNLIIPLFEQIQLFLPDITPALTNLEINKKKWEERVPEFEQELSKPPHLASVVNYSLEQLQSANQSPRASPSPRNAKK